MLSREQMVEVIRGGGSVNYRGRIIVTEAKLPSALDLARTDEEKLAAKTNLQKQIEEQQRQLASFEAPVAAETGETKPDGKKK